ncbi:hypothetical protein M2282_000238 [Variovorax boronicumulans]|uniref:hypothetical protein n=1 Tax=Variovorax boronicumulans TaxID=436515 RepID=UPI0024763C7F|nr:hypothetical protein [Variovorax boronicumulans]MDH6165110.1 hypothetical protein [Variovorax boronicumulans]
MKLKSLGWLLVLLLAGIVFFLMAALAWIAGVGWSLGLLGLVWGIFLLAEVKRWVPLRDVAWVAGVAYGVGMIRWFDLPVEGLSAAQRWLMMGADLLCLVFFALIAPALLAWVAERLRPAAEPDLPVEAPPSPEMLRRWDPRD